jgi:hypothetical protein
MGNIFTKLFSYKEKRSDIIEDVLSHIVKGTDVPIAQYAINTCFV